MRTSTDIFWQDTETPYESNKELIGEQDADVAVLGGGVTGMAAAYHIKKRFPDKKVVILEGEYVGYGASGRNAGFGVGTTGNNLHSLMTIKTMMGEDNARLMQALSFKGYQILENLIQEHGIECNCEKPGFMILSENDKENKILEKMHNVLNETGANSTWLDREQTKDRFSGPTMREGIYCPDNLLLNPAKFVRGMKNVVESLGVEVHEHSRCTHIEQGPIHRVHTARGVVYARDLVMATNAYPNPLGLNHYKVIPTYVHYIVTDPLSKSQLDDFGWQGREGIFGVKSFFWLIRLTPDNRFVYSSSNAMYFKNIYRDYSHWPKEYRNMHKQMIGRFPVLKDMNISHQWGGRIGLTMHCLPVIGKTGKNDNIYYAMGYNGHGLAWSQLTGKIISELVAKDRSELTENTLVNKYAFGVPSATLTHIAVKILTYYYKLLDKMLDI